MDDRHGFPDAILVRRRGFENGATGDAIAMIRVKARDRMGRGAISAARFEDRKPAEPVCTKAHGPIRGPLKDKSGEKRVVHGKSRGGG